MRGYGLALAIFLPVNLFLLEVLPKSLFRRFPYRALAFLAQQVIGGEVDYRFALLGRSVDSLGQGIGVAEGQPYRLLTSTFLHGNFLHLALNMILLFILGTQLEAELGRVRFAALYLISALGGSAASYAFGA